MRPFASILHLDLDAFFAAVEQRDKPSLRGKAVVVGGVGPRGVVATASYEARVHGVKSAMSIGEARRRAPHAAYLNGRFDAYRQSSRIVMALLRELSPVVEPLSLDEAFVDLAAGGVDCSDLDRLRHLGDEVRAELYRRTEGLTASVGIGSSKFIAKVASEMAKPNGLVLVPPGSEVEVITPLPARAVPGIGPVTMEKLERLGIRTVGDLQRASVGELAHEIGRSAAEGLCELAFARDDRPVEPVREAKSISVEDTFATDLVDPGEISRRVDVASALVTERLGRAGLFARTISVKVRLGDFTTWTRSRTLSGATDAGERIASVAHALVGGLELREGVRLLGVGVSNFTVAAQEELFSLDEAGEPVTEEMTPPVEALPRRRDDLWVPGMEVAHDEFGRGWVWGSGLGRLTVRFESRGTPIGPVRTFAIDDPALHCDVDLIGMDADPGAPGE